jgi:hypothetical protein
VRKAVDDVYWQQRLGDVAEVDKVTSARRTRMARRRTASPTPAIPLKVFQYVFVPKRSTAPCRHPLIVLPHGGVHGDFGTYHTHIVRELM